MSLAETNENGSELPHSGPDVDGPGDSVVVGRDAAVRATAEPRWGFLATVGFSIVVLAVFLGLQIAVAIGFVVVQMAVGGHVLNEAEAEALRSNGLLLSLATLISMPPGLVLVALFAKLKRGATIRGYLGLRTVSWRVGLTWLGVTLVYAAAVDALTYFLGRPIVSEVIASAYSSAGFLPLLLVALIVMAPLFEEAFFRGFVLEGLRHTRLGPIGAIVVTAITWAAIHVQYDAYQIATIFVGGLVLGTAKTRTGSLFLTMAMHGLQNIIATVETAIYVHLQLNGGG